MISAEASGRCRTTRVFTVLDLISRTRGVRLTKIAERAGLPITTTHRLLAELVELGVVERRNDGYQIGSVLFDMALRAPARADLINAAGPALHDLYIQNGETVFLATLSGTVVSVIDAISAGCAQKQLRGGDQMPAHATAAGKCLLALMGNAAPPVRLERVTPRTLTNYNLFTQQLQMVLQSGYAVDVEEWRVGLASVAAPIFSNGTAVAALVASFPIHKFRPEQSAGKTIRAANQATAQLAAGRISGNAEEFVLDMNRSAEATPRRAPARRPRALAMPQLSRSAV